MDDLEGRRPEKNFTRNMALARTGMTLGIVGLSAVGGYALLRRQGEAASITWVPYSLVPAPLYSAVGWR